MNLIHSTRPECLARAYCGMWIVDCPRCRDARQLPFRTATYECVYCGLGMEPVWPSEAMRVGVERLLSLRPIAYTQNWTPGETLHDLLAENVAHGIGPGAGESIMILGDRVVVDTLPAVVSRLPIGA